MPEKVRVAMHPELVVGGLLVAVGAAAFLGESNAAMAHAIIKLWPAALIGWGVALLIRTAERV
jgi:hypothetical protein